MPIAAKGPINTAIGKVKDFFRERNKQADATVATLDKIDTRRSQQAASDTEKRNAEKKSQAERAQAKRDAKSSSSEKVINKAKGGKVGSASKRADGCATKGKTKGRFV